MNNSFPPLYPEEAYSQQNNNRAFVNDGAQTFSQPNEQNQNGQNGGMLGALLSGGNGMSALLPLLLKSMGGGSSALGGDMLKSLGADSSNPLAAIFGSLPGNKKNSPAPSTEEKEFPET